MRQYFVTYGGASGRPFLQSLVVLIFGLLFPAYLLFQAQQGIVAAAHDFDVVKPMARVEDLVPKASLDQGLASFDYSIATTIFIESSGRQVMLNKQHMRMAVINVGFALLSVGLMLIFLGVDAGGLDFAMQQGSKFSAALKVTSTGVLALTLGGVMVLLAGVLPNEYKSAGVPGFGRGAALGADAASANDVEVKADQYVSYFRGTLEGCAHEYQHDQAKQANCVREEVSEFVKRSGAKE